MEKPAIELELAVTHLEAVRELLRAMLLQLRKVPMLRDPWEHAIFIGLGAYCGDWLVKYEERTAREVDDILLRRSEKNKNISKSETGPVV